MALACLAALALTSCGFKSQGSKEQIENARQEAEEMTGAFRENLRQNEGVKVVNLPDAQNKAAAEDENSTEIIVSEEPAPAPAAEK